MKLSFSLSTDEAIALRRLAAKYDCDLDQTAKMALRDWLIGHGYLEILEADNDDVDG